MGTFDLIQTHTHTQEAWSILINTSGSGKNQLEKSWIFGSGSSISAPAIMISLLGVSIYAPVVSQPRSNGKVKLAAKKKPQNNIQTEMKSWKQDEIERGVIQLLCC